MVPDSKVQEQRLDQSEAIQSASNDEKSICNNSRTSVLVDIKVWRGCWFSNKEKYRDVQKDKKDLWRDRSKFIIGGNETCMVARARGSAKII